MEERKNIKGKIGYFITIIILCIIVYFAYQNYQTKNFNDFIKSERELYISKFYRDKDIKYGKKPSYKIISNQFNDAMFYKKVKVNPNSSYRVTCMVKTNNVEPEEAIKAIGAQISIEGSFERSIAVQGTSDWQKIELLFNSKDREEVNLGFRLGGNAGRAKGEAWFSEFTLEEGSQGEDNTWKYACFIYRTTNVKINNKEIKLSVTESDMNDIRNMINRYENSCISLSEKKMIADCDIYEITNPLDSLSYDNEFGYYVAPEDVEDDIKETIANGDYDHIFVIIRLRRRTKRNKSK